MSLRDVEEYRRWVEREGPSPAAQRVVRLFLAEVGDQAWKVPSVPIPEMSRQPEFEVRQAELVVDGENRPAVIWCRHTYVNDAVDVIAVSNA